MRRSFDKLAVLSDFKFISKANIVGTPANTVTCSRAITSSNLTGKANDRSNTTVAPTPAAINTW